jgi:hypothetical protein
VNVLECGQIVRQVKSIEISEECLVDFETAVTGTIDRAYAAPPDWPLSVPREKGSRSLIVSYDGEWLPFFPLTMGHSKNEDRLWILPLPILLRRVGALGQDDSIHRGYDRAGGRFFLCAEGAWKKTPGTGERYWIAAWTLPRASDLLPPTPERYQRPGPLGENWG